MGAKPSLVPKEYFVFSLRNLQQFVQNQEDKEKELCEFVCQHIKPGVNFELVEESCDHEPQHKLRHYKSGCIVKPYECPLSIHTLFQRVTFTESPETANYMFYLTPKQSRILQKLNQKRKL